MLISSSLIFICTVQLFAGLAGAAVSPGQLGVLTREQLLELDREVSQYYREDYAQLTNRSYEEQLHRSIRSLRHTVVLNHFDFRYTRNETKWDSQGPQVDSELCKLQLRALSQAANKTLKLQSVEEPPLSIVDFIGANAKPGSGILNGNFIWLGSHSSCARARIPAHLLQSYLGDDSPQEELQQDIRGRYCVAHLRAKSWPKWDPYFEDRLTIKSAVCLPDSCHTAIYEQDVELQLLVDHLARFSLSPPFNSDRYETQTLYCLPDEDSPYRQLDLGAKLFLLFIGLWILSTFYLNVKYYRRQSALKKLRDAVDIKMIINEKHDESVELSYGSKSAAAATQAKEPQDETPNDEPSQRLGTDLGQVNHGASLSAAASSPAIALLPGGLESEEEELWHDVAPGSIASGAKEKRREKTKSKSDQREQRPKGGGASEGSTNYAYDCHQEDIQAMNDESFHLLRAFAIEPNLNYLFTPRSTTSMGSEQDSKVNSEYGKQQRSVYKTNRSSPQLAAVARRTSSSNEALIKNLQERGGDHQSKAAIISKAAAGRSKHSDGSTRERRVNIEILDGLKVIATSYIVIGHTLMIFFGGVSDLRFGHERMFDLTMVVAINALQVVGLFYITTGCLLTYFSFSKTKPKQLLSPVFWLLVVVGRYIRLIPAYALVFWFARHVAPYTGYGPDWYDYRTDEEHARGACAQESWWVMWTMSAADIKIPMDCVPQAWYLSIDFRTLLILPVYVYLLAKNALLGYSAIFATLVYSTFKLVEILKLANIDYKIILNWQPHTYSLMADRLHDVYTDASVRMSTYLLGVIVGHLLYLYERRHIRKWPRLFSRWGMKVALISGVCFFCGCQVLSAPLVNQFLPHRDELSSETVVWLIPLFKTSMELCICSAIMLIVTGHGYPFVRHLLSSQAMKILSSISYCVFLTHIEIMYKLPGPWIESNYWTFFLYATFFTVVSHAVSLVLHVLFEMPVHNMTRHVFKKAFRAIS